MKISMLWTAAAFALVLTMTGPAAGDTGFPSSGTISVTVTGMRSTSLTDGSEFLAVSFSASLPVTGCTSTWFTFAYSLHSTQPNYKTLVALLTSAYLSGKPVTAGAITAGCTGINSTYQLSELSFG
jgi:hypothetical protein